MQQAEEHAAELRKASAFGFGFKNFINNLRGGAGGAGGAK